MKGVILAGGLVTRKAKETAAKPKPMVEIGGKPVRCHIKKSNSQRGRGARAAVPATDRTACPWPVSKASSSTRHDFEWRGKHHAMP